VSGSQLPVEAREKAGRWKRGRRELARQTPVQYVTAHGPRRRLDRLVLLDIAAKADWAAATWGESAFPSVPHIGARIGYCDRSVQYALRRLEAGGYLELTFRPGRTSVCRIVRHLEAVPAVEDDPGTGDNPVHNSGRGVIPATLTVAPGGAKVAPDQVPLPRATTPVGPSVARNGKSEAAGAAAQAAQRAPHRGPVSREPPGTPPAGPEPPRHRPEGGQPAARERPGRRLEGPRPWLWSPSGVRQRTPGRNGPRKRDVVRERVRCPECDAPPGVNCRGNRGQSRSSNHASRRLPDDSPG
jgi:hypothetical protein